MTQAGMEEEQNRAGGEEFAIFCECGAVWGKLAMQVPL